MSANRPLSILALLVAASAALALPEDAEQPINGTYDSSLLLLDEGRQFFYGSDTSPARITQGTLLITGTEIIIERRDGEVRKVTVTGNQAHFQQQPESNQAIIMGDANSIVLDYDTQHVSADGNVRFTQGNALWTGCHIDYYMESRRLTTPVCEDGQQARAVIPPRTDP